MQRVVPQLGIAEPVTPLHSDTEPASRGTRVDLRATVLPAEAPLVALQNLARQCLADLHDRTDRESRLIVRLANGVCAALAVLSLTERALLFAEARVQFTERGVMEQQATIDDLRGKLEDARASLNLLAQESFEVITRNEGEGFEAQPTGVHHAEQAP